MPTPAAHPFANDGGFCVTVIDGRECGLPKGNIRHRDPDGPPPVERNVARVGARHPGTSHAAAANALPGTGTIRRAIFDYLLANLDGTDDRLEEHLSRSHQSVSAARNSLMRDGLIEPLVDDEGKTVTRPTRYGNEAVVWAPTAAARARAIGYAR